MHAVEKGGGLTLAAENGVIPPPAPLDVNDPASWERRVAAARTAGAYFGVPVPPLTGEEADGLSAGYRKADVDGLVSSLAVICWTIRKTCCRITSTQTVR